MPEPIYHFDIVQGTSEWLAIRAGKWTASNGATIMGGLTTKGLDDLIKDIAWGRVFGPTDPGFQSDAMKRGTETESEAREWCAFERGVVIEQCGFVEHPTIPNLGWSPDGLFADRKLAVEIKCPLHRGWIDTELAREIPSQYRWQCRFACFVGGLDGIEFVNYHPLAGGVVIPLEISDSERDQIEARIALLEPRVQAIVNKLQERRA